MTDPKGFDVYRIYVEITGNALTREFWLWYNKWCAAHHARDTALIDSLQNDPSIEIYSVWVEDVKSVIKEANSPAGRKKRD